MTIKKILDKIWQIGTAPRQYYLFGMYGFMFLINGSLFLFAGQFKDNIQTVIGILMEVAGAGWLIGLYYFYQYRKLLKKVNNVA